MRRLAKAASETLDSPVIAQRYRELGVTVPPPERRTPEYLAKFVPSEIAHWAGPIKASGVSMD